MEIDAAVVLHAGRLFRHRADIITLIGESGISEPDADRRFKDLLGMLHRLGTARQSRKHRPKLRNQEYLAFVAVRAAHDDVVVGTGIKIIAALFVPAVSLDALLHDFAALVGGPCVVLFAKPACDLRKLTVCAAPRDGKPYRNAFPFQSGVVDAVVPVAAPNADKSVKSLEIV